MNRLTALLVFVLIPFICLYSQNKFISDTTIIEVPVDSTLTKINASINIFQDDRLGEENVLRITQKNIYNYIPVDHYININKPVGEYFTDFFENSGNTIYDFKINRFEIDERKGLIYPALSLNAIIEVVKYSSNNTDTTYGTLIYNEEINARAKGKEPAQKEKKLLTNWEKEFQKDISQITDCINASDPLPYNFRSSELTYQTNLQMSSRFIGGLDFWMLEGEVIFVEPEASKKFKQSGYMFRYRNEKKFESISFSRNSEHFIYRLNNNLLFDINTNFLIGVNKWRDMWEAEHPIWHILLLEASATQYVLYTPFNSNPSFVFGAGILESIYYVPDGLFKFKPGLSVQLGYRF